MIRKLLLTYLIAACHVTGMKAAQVPITVDCATQIDTLERFWTGIGFTPAKMLLDKDYQQYMAYVGSIPYNGIDRVRIHDFLQLVRSDWEKREYDWQQLDEAMDVLHRNDIGHIFEIMGRRPDDDAPDSLYYVYRDFIKAMADHFIDRYGRDEVRSWIFETRNESRKYLEKPYGKKYYDACSEGLRLADPRLRFGGPGYRPGSPFSFVQQCKETNNFFSDEKGTRLDFVSVHIKEPATYQTTREIEIIKEIREQYPEMADVLFVNDEHDPWGDWVKNQRAWAGGPKFAAYICNATNQHLIRIIDSLQQPYWASHDNGFLGHWDCRTQMVGWHEGFDGLRTYSRHNPPGINWNKFVIIKKPSHNAFIMLSLLGEKRLAITGEPDITRGAGIIATIRPQNDNQIAVLLYNEGKIGDNRRIPEDLGDLDIALSLENIPFAAGMLAHYRIDSTHSNPEPIWPDTIDPPYEKTLELRENMELASLEEPKEFTTENGILSMTVPLPRNSVSLLLLTRKPQAPPSPVRNVRVEKYPNLYGHTEYMVLWDEPPGRTIKTYEVLYSENENGPYTRVNKPDIICTAFLHSGPQEEGYYKVVAVDFWGRRSGDLVHAKSFPRRPLDNTKISRKPRLTVTPFQRPYDKDMKKTFLLNGKTAPLLSREKTGKKKAAEFVPTVIIHEE